MTLDTTLAVGRQAASVLEAPPEDLAAGYTDDEIAAQYAATDRLLAAFRALESQIGCSEPEHPPHEEGER